VGILVFTVKRRDYMPRCPEALLHLLQPTAIATLRIRLGKSSSLSKTSVSEAPDQVAWLLRRIGDMAQFGALKKCRDERQNRPSPRVDYNQGDPPVRVLHLFDIYSEMKSEIYVLSCFDDIAERICSDDWARGAVCYSEKEDSPTFVSHLHAIGE
jgi:hypothetical protein